MSESVGSVGCDLVEFSRVKQLYEKQGEEFPQTLLSSNELKTFKKTENAVLFLAQRFAGKEAVYKALRTQLEKGVKWKDVDLSFSEKLGWAVHLSGMAQARAHELGLQHFNLSITRVGDHLMASVVGEAK